MQHFFWLRNNQSSPLKKLVVSVLCCGIFKRWINNMKSRVFHEPRPHSAQHSIYTYMYTHVFVVLCKLGYRSARCLVGAVPRAFPLFGEALLERKSAAFKNMALTRLRDSAATKAAPQIRCLLGRSLSKSYSACLQFRCLPGWKLSW